METNQLVMSGTVTELFGLRHSPAGVPHQSFMLEHRSRQEEAGVAREVVCRIRVEARGEMLVSQLGGLAISDRVCVTGFLARSGHRDTAASRLVLHVQQIELR